MLITAWQSRCFVFDFQVNDSNGNPITVKSADTIRVTIGHENAPPVFILDTTANSQAGSSITKNVSSKTNRLEIVEADLTFPSGQYTLIFDFIDSTDHNRVKNSARHVFSLNGGTGNIVDVSEVLLDMGFSGSATDEQIAIVRSCIVSAEAAVKRFLKYDPTYQLQTEFYPSIDVTRTGREYIWEVSQTQAFLRQLSEMSTVELQIRRLPIRSVVVGDVKYPQVYIDYDGRFGSRDGSFNNETLRQEGPDYWPKYDGVDSSGNKYCLDGILTSIGLWPAVAGCVKVVYYAGYKPTELRGQDPVIDASPIWEATKEEAVRRVAKRFTVRMNRLGVWGPLTSENLGSYSYSRDAQTMQKLVMGGDLLQSSVDKLQHYENWGASLMS